jgi:putative hydroxymethylpyrimidine transport system substrate-binding protein
VRRSALLLLALLAVGCGSGGSGQRPAAGATRPVSLTLDWTPNPDHVAVFYAQRHGQFAREDLAVRVQAPADPTTPLKLVAAGRTDLAISYEPELFFAAQRGLPVKAVASVVAQPLDSLILRQGGGSSPAALEGKKVGVTGVPTDAAFLETMLRRAVVDPESVKTVHVGYSLLPALLAGRVDAILGGYRNVEAIELRQRGLRPSVIPVDRAGVPSYDELVLVASARRLHDPAYRSVVRRFVAALSAATAAARRDPRGALAAVRASTKASPRFLAASVPATLAVLGSAPCLTRAAWQGFGDWMLRSGLVKKRVAARDVVTTEFLPPACARR